MNPSTGTFISMDIYEGSIYDPDTLHKYLYANGNPVTYSDPSGNMFDFSSTAMGMGIQNVLNNAVQISYRGLMCGLINMTLTAVMGGSWEQAKSSFVTGFILGAGISAVKYFVVGEKLVTLARFYVLSASANFIFSATMTVFAVTKGYSNLAVTFGVMVILSIAEWCWAYGKYLLIDVYGNNGSATIECNPSGGSNTVDDFIKNNVDPNFQQNVKDAFMDDATVTVLDKDVVVYRYHGGSSQGVSYWYTPNQTANPAADLALPQGNTYQYMDTYVIPKGTIILEGTVAPNFGQPGGGYQLYVSDPSVVIKK